MKKQMEMIQRVLLEKRSQGSGVRSQGSGVSGQWSGARGGDSEILCLRLVAAIGMAGWLVLVIGHCI